MNEFELKKITKEGIPGALKRALRYRELGEPVAAESICLDIIAADTENQEALEMLILALTDQFAIGLSKTQLKPKDLAKSLKSEYDRSYYSGIICERQGKATLIRNYPGADFDAFEWFVDAMEHYDRAEELKSAGNDDAILRWNNCARVIMNRKLQARPEEEQTIFGE